MPQDERQSNVFRPSVSPSARGGLLLIDAAGNRMVIPDAEVEAFLDDMESVRRRQIINECRQIAGLMDRPS